MLQHAATCCNMLQHAAACNMCKTYIPPFLPSNIHRYTHGNEAWLQITPPTLLQCVAACCRVLHAECCRVLQSVVGCCRVLQGVAECCRVFHSVAECYKVLHAECCSVITPPHCCHLIWMSHVSHMESSCAANQRGMSTSDTHISATHIIGLFCRISSLL